MGWPNIPRLIYTDAVSVRRVAWAQDAIKGRQAAYPDGWSGESYECSVSAASADDQVRHSRENMIVTHCVTCNTRLGSIRDQLLWAETGAVLTIVGVEPAGDGTGRVWNHYTEEHPAR